MTTCPHCEVERDPSYITNNGFCVFCVEAGATPPEPPEPKRTYKKRTTSVKIDPAKPNPPETPQTTAKTTTSDRYPTQELEDAVTAIPYVAPTFDNVAAERDPQQELAMRVLCRRRLMPFIKRFRPKYSAGWAHEDICRRLENFIAAVERGESPRMLIMCPPRFGKSEIGSRHFAPWALGRHPDWEIIAASHTSSLTLSFSRYIRDLLRDPAYHAVFSDARLDPQSQSVENWNLTGGGGYLAAGVGTGITGRGAHILLLDDLVKDIEAADSATITENTWEWYGSTAYTRLAPGGGVLGIMTWWSEADWAGRIQAVMASGEGDVFEIVKYPAINEDGDEYILEKLPGRPIRQFLPGEPVPEGATLTRPHGTAVHPARYNTDAMLRIKRNLIATGQKRVWQALYQQNPIPDDGLFFTKDMFRYYGSLPPRHHCRVYQAWDFAITEEQQSDYTVGVTIWQDPFDNLYVADVTRFRSSDSIYIVDTILDYAHMHHADLLGFEDGQIWKTMDAQFKKRCDERRFYPSFEVLKPLTDKVVRAHPLRGRMQAGKIYFGDRQPWFQTLYNEMTRFPAGKHDDQIDAMAWAVRLTLDKIAPKVADKTPKIKSWKDKLPGIGKQGTTYMSG